MTITAKYNGICTFCGGAVKAGEKCEYDPTAKKVSHVSCTRSIKGAQGKKVAGGEYAHEYGKSAVLNMVENRQGKYIVRLIFAEYGATYDRHIGGNSTGSITRDQAEQAFDNAVAKLKSMGYVIIKEA